MANRSLKPWNYPNWETTKSWQDLIWKLKKDYESHGFDKRFERKLDGFFDLALNGDGKIKYG